MLHSQTDIHEFVVHASAHHRDWCTRTCVWNIIYPKLAGLFDKSLQYHKTNCFKIYIQLASKFLVIHIWIIHLINEVVLRHAILWSLWTPNMKFIHSYIHIMSSVYLFGNFVHVASNVINSHWCKDEDNIYFFAFIPPKRKVLKRRTFFHVIYDTNTDINLKKCNKINPSGSQKKAKKPMKF